ncbi:MAG: NADH-quinone oxidoreductase subunit G [Alphaproteobacteria bacterium RIFCSPLOWO2_01_FULL_40_26]|nr:MAG: NADH-quinone oxidoreductase subunit G [Alphaproteobacteria bacterium RIFCSPHIGHO2_02_FULL_40_34]OFW95370.1 MAG: NADH-quinone oxidoreductase subunit G [Alphaproteobacteria bacterium RIFCSPLOWO2_01_FULL_40_26]OFX09266.1 MAG: NADH-quinone oxidoreductase subunit G [Alphaproteobacteria bacterium RIFCSPLOWO2_02_FULL_40_19]OFX10804.1 MAG: NADH-quinone oxidoreductase subunit G [Alphaproteobacteria bacterium RIFCSPLOWO2_12_FULL_40_11]
MPKITINGKEHQVPEGITIIQACEIADVEIPRFCYHERLAIAGNCRMCLVEVEGMPPKPVASCAMPIADGMKIHTDTPMVKKAREGVMEFLLANHPLDCPICDQGGECDLQDQAYQYGRGKSEYHEHKRAVKDKNMGPLIKTQMTRCIQCTRCIRFVEDVAGTVELGAISRGENMEITTYLDANIKSELSGNIIDLCPVGALTSKPYAFKARSWELKKTETIDVMDAVGSNIRIDSRGIEVMRILPRLNEEINEEWISDKTRFCYDGLKYQRLDKPYVKRDGKLQRASFDEAYDEIVAKIKSVRIGEIAALSGQLSSACENLALKNLLEKIGVRNFDCRLKGEKFNAYDCASYLFNTTIAGIEEADVCLLICVNPRKDAPIINARIRKRFLSKKIKIAAIGCKADLTYDYEHLGDDIWVLKEILDGHGKFAETLKNAKNPMLILGHDVVVRSDGDLVCAYSKKIAENYNMIRDGWNGHVANQLSEKSDPLIYKDSSSLKMVRNGDLRQSWNGFNFLSKSTGLLNGLITGFVGDSNVSEILSKTEKGEIKLVILHAVDDDIDFEKLKDCFVVYIGTHGDRGAHIADVILPSAAYSEKEAIYFNCEGRKQKTSRAVFAPGEAREDIKIIQELAQKLEAAIKLEEPEIVKKDWVKSGAIKADFIDKQIMIQDFDFYLTNPIARASRTLNKCSAPLQSE